MSKFESYRSQARAYTALSVLAFVCTALNLVCFSLAYVQEQQTRWTIYACTSCVWLVCGFINRGTARGYRRMAEREDANQ